MAITGGNYLGALFGDPRAAVPAAFCYLIVVSVLNALGSRLAGGVQTVATTTLVLLIATVAVAPFATPGFTAAGTVAPVGSWTAALPVVGLIFFAYTGWELVASTTEEYRNPRRDLPLVLGLSFAVIVTLYVGVALAVQVTLAPDDPLLRTAPLVAVLNRVVGEARARATAALGCAIIFTTLMGGTWATSRIAFATARERLLPLRLSRVHSGSGAPRPAIVVSALLFGGVMLAYASGALTLDVIIKLSAVNFIIGYAISIAAYARFCIRWRERLIAVLAAGPIIGLLVGFGWWLLLPFALFAMGVAAHRLSRDGVLVEVRAAALTRAGDDDPIRS
jgi:amino acid efflux transporter